MTDRDRCFHPISFTISTGESMKECKFSILSVMNALERIYDSTLDIQSFIGDGAESITNAFLSVFGCEKRRLMCWAHACRAIDSKIESLIPKNHQNSFKTSIRIIQLCINDEEFELAISL